MFLFNFLVLRGCVDFKHMSLKSDVSFTSISVNIFIVEFIAEHESDVKFETELIKLKGSSIEITINKNNR